MTDDLRQQLIRIDRDHSHLRRRFASDVEVAPAGNEGFRAVKQADDDDDDDEVEIEVKLELSTDPEKGSRSITVTMDPGEDGNADVHIDRGGGGSSPEKSQGPQLKHKLVKLLRS